MGETSTLILNAARNILEQEGASAISMRRIAKDVGVTAGALYRHFPDRNSIIETIVREGFAEMEERIAASIQGLRGLTSLKSILLEYARFALECPHYYQCMFMQERPGVFDFTSQLAKGESSAFNLAVDAVSQSIDLGQLKPGDPPRITLTLWAHMHGLVALQYTGRFGQDHSGFLDLSRESLERVLDGLAS